MYKIFIIIFIYVFFLSVLCIVYIRFFFRGIRDNIDVTGIKIRFKGIFGVYNNLPF